MKFLVILLSAFAANASSFVQSSANYTISEEVCDAGGTRCASSNYSNDGSIGGLGGLISDSASQVADRTGYIGQLSEVTAFALVAAGTNLNQGASLPLSAVQFFDDGTATAANDGALWTYASPIVSVDWSGLVTAGIVSQNTPAVVQASLEGWSASLSLMVLFTGSLPGYNETTGQLLSDGNMRFSFVGFPGVNYALDRTYNLSPPIRWIPQMTNLAGVSGVLMFTNWANPVTNDFWRIRSVP